MLGSTAAKQSGDGSTLDVIKNLVQKLPLAERSSLNSLLAAQLKSGGGAAHISLFLPAPIFDCCGLRPHSRLVHM